MKNQKLHEILDLIMQGIDKGIDANFQILGNYARPILSASIYDEGKSIWYASLSDHQDEAISILTKVLTNGIECLPNYISAKQQSDSAELEQYNKLKAKFEPKGEVI